MGKLLAIIGLTQKAYGRWMLQRFLLGALVVLGLMIIIGILTSALIVALFYVLYVILVHFDVPSLTAMLEVCGIAGLCIALLVAYTCRYVKQLKTLESTMFKKGGTGRVMGTVQAFFDGLTNG